jgi:hypothetical protein
MIGDRAALGGARKKTLTPHVPSCSMRTVNNESRHPPDDRRFSNQICARFGFQASTHFSCGF